MRVEVDDRAAVPGEHVLAGADAHPRRTEFERGETADLDAGSYLPGSGDAATAGTVAEIDVRRRGRREIRTRR